MNVNFHIDQNIETEHAEFFIQELTPNLQKIAHELMRENKLMWGYVDQQIIPIDYNEIIVIRIQRNKVVAITVSSQEMTLKERLYQLADFLPDNFIRVSKSEIININKIKHLEVSLNGLINVILENNEIAFVSRRNMKLLKGRLGL